MTLRFFQFALVLLIGFAIQGQVSLSMVKNTQDDYFCFQADNVPIELIREWKRGGSNPTWWSEYFKISIDNAETGMLGKYVLVRRRLLFIPKFPLDQGASYKLQFQKERLSVEIPWQSAPTRVINFFPKGEIPANTLRMYLYFSAPMGLQNPHEFISLIGEGQEKINNPFVEIETGLWNEDRTRLTLFFHPGRLKSGVSSNEKFGPILKEGKNYHLVLAKGWKDQNGRPLDAFTLIELEVTEPVKSLLDPHKWIAKKGYSDVVFTLNGVLDQEIVRRKIQLFFGEKKLSGSWQAKSDELRFISENKLPMGTYRLQLDPTLEDVCGNSLLNTFETKTKRQPVSTEPISVSFDLSRVTIRAKR